MKPAWRPPASRPEVYRITAAAPGLHADVAARQKRYLISMGVRTACFLLAVVASGWLRWVFMVAAIVLPYFAVIIANAGRGPVEAPPPTITGADVRPALPGASAPERRSA